MSEESPASLESEPANIIDMADIPQAPSPDAPGAEAEPKLADADVSRAVELGFSEEDIESFGDSLPSILNRVEAEAFRRYNAMRSRQLPAEPPVQGNPPHWSNGQNQPQQQWGGPQPQQPPQQPTAPAGYKVQLDTSDYDDGLVAELNRMNEYYAGQMQQLTDALQSQQQLAYNSAQQQQMAAVQDLAAWFDTKVSDLGDDYHAVFGKGSWQNMPQGSAELNARGDLFEKFQDFLEFNGVPMAKSDELWDRFATVVIGTDSTIKQRQLSAQLRRGSQKTISRPNTQRRKVDRSVRDPTTGMAQADVDALRDMHSKMLQKNQLE